MKAHHSRLFIDFVNFVIVILSIASTCFCRISKANFIPNKEKRDYISLMTPVTLRGEDGIQNNPECEMKRAKYTEKIIESTDSMRKHRQTKNISKTSRA